jgi:glucosyl-3-phosphoglycerate synthase
MVGPESTAAWEWFVGRTYHHARFEEGGLVTAKRDRGLTVSVCLPTRNEADTIGEIVRCIVKAFPRRKGLIDELVVMDSDSTDGTAEIAQKAGATVYQDRDILPELEPLGGKGDALWKALFVLKGDLVVFLDSDIRNFHPRFITGLLGPLLCEEGVHYVKAFYERPIKDGSGELAATGGGRVTELVARPLLNMFFPGLAGVAQPLSGEYAGTREVFEAVPFFTGYGVEFGLLVDIAELVGIDGVAQVDLDIRVHRIQAVPELSRMAFGIIQAALARLASTGRIDIRTELGKVLYQFKTVDGGYEPEPWLIDIKERPPASTVPGYRARLEGEAAGLEP